MLATPGKAGWFFGCAPCPSDWEGDGETHKLQVLLDEHDTRVVLYYYSATKKTWSTGSSAQEHRHHDERARRDVPGPSFRHPDTGLTCADDARLGGDRSNEEARFARHLRLGLVREILHWRWNSPSPTQRHRSFCSGPGRDGRRRWRRWATASSRWTSHGRTACSCWGRTGSRTGRWNPRERSFYSAVKKQSILEAGVLDDTYVRVSLTGVTRDDDDTRVVTVLRRACEKLRLVRTSLLRFLPTKLGCSGLSTETGVCFVSDHPFFYEFLHEHLRERALGVRAVVREAFHARRQDAAAGERDPQIRGTRFHDGIRVDERKRAFECAECASSSSLVSSFAVASEEKTFAMRFVASETNTGSTKSSSTQLGCGSSTSRRPSINSSRNRSCPRAARLALRRGGQRGDLTCVAAARSTRETSAGSRAHRTLRVGRRALFRSFKLFV